ncbi:peroxiredoxin family protein, partial [bacterium]|nr:peroxiredoxin family protein [bacterium]
MRRLVLLVGMVLMVESASALFGVGNKPTNYCWTDYQGQKVCLEDPAIQHRVRVLLYNAGWCGPCNDEFGELKDATDEYQGKPVTFISLSSEGWNYGSRADASFLSNWRTTHKLDQAMADFIVASSPR